MIKIFVEAPSLTQPSFFNSLIEADEAASKLGGIVTIVDRDEVTRFAMGEVEMMYLNDLTQQVRDLIGEVA